MYYNKKYWNYLIKLYRFNIINDRSLESISTVRNSKIPIIFKNFSYILLYDGKKKKKIYLKFTNINIK